MNRKILNTFLDKFGYEISKKKPILDNSKDYQLHQYLKEDGSFDYDEYVKIQSNANRKKIKQSWVQEENIDFISKYLIERIYPINFGLCHGTRRGLEQEWFRKYLLCDVIGTEISDTATQFPHTIQWDFHKYKPEWLRSVDFIYSNSFDHSFNPEECINSWMSCLTANGLCIIEHTNENDAEASIVDPFGASLIQMPYLILKWGKGKFYVREILKAPYKPSWVHDLSFIIIENT